MIDKKCKNCRWFDKEDIDDISDGYCRKHPPAVTDAGYGVWPTVDGELDWCGEYDVSFEFWGEANNDKVH